MVKILLKKQFTEIFRAYFYDAKKNKARSKAAVTGYIVLFVFLMVGILGGMFTYLSIALCKPLSAAGLGWLYFAIMGIISILLGAFGSVFNTYSFIYAHTRGYYYALPPARGLPYGAYVFGRGAYSRGGGIYYNRVAQPARRYRLHFACAFNFGFCAYPFKRARLGSGKNKLKAEK